MIISQLDRNDISVKKSSGETARKISGKIEFSHHGFVMAFFMRRKQRKAPHEAGQKDDYLYLSKTAL